MPSFGQKSFLWDRLSSLIVCLMSIREGIGQKSAEINSQTRIETMIEANEKQNPIEVMEATRINGIELEVLQGTLQAIQEDPVLADCKFRASNTWLSANHNRSTVSGFYGAKQEIAHKQTFTMDADEPPILAGQDQGANPVEHLLHALASCVTTSMVAHAAVLGINIEALESELEGDIDLRGFLGLDPEVPKGFTDIRVNFKVKSDVKNIDRLKGLTAFSPVFNTITQGANVDIQVQPM